MFDKDGIIIVEKTQIGYCGGSQKRVRYTEERVFVTDKEIIKMYKHITDKTK